jgi:hypothetical protein
MSDKPAAVRTAGEVLLTTSHSSLTTFPDFCKQSRFRRSSHSNSGHSIPERKIPEQNEIPGGLHD